MRRMLLVLVFVAVLLGLPAAPALAAPSPPGAALFLEHAAGNFPAQSAVNVSGRCAQLVTPTGSITSDLFCA